MSLYISIVIVHMSIVSSRLAPSRFPIGFPTPEPTRVCVRLKLKLVADLKPIEINGHKHRNSTMQRARAAVENSEAPRSDLGPSSTAFELYDDSTT